MIETLEYIYFQSMRKIAQIFVCFSEGPNFTSVVRVNEQNERC